MNRCALGLVVSLFLALAASPDSCAAQTLIAGTGGSPPAFSSSFIGLLSHLDVATPFTVPPGSPYAVTQFQTPAFHYPGLAGTTARFAIHADVAGAPGAELVAFPTDDITTTEQVLTLAPSHVLVLQPATRYWLAGGTLGEQVNWNIPAGNVFGQLASRNTSTGVWTVQPGDNGNIPAFAVLGTAVPEPAGLALAGLAIIAARACRRKRSGAMSSSAWTCCSSNLEPDMATPANRRGHGARRRR
jgi:hypothetical protein